MPRFERLTAGKDCPLECLPDEVICHILRFLPYFDRIAITQTCRLLCTLSRSPQSGTVTFRASRPNYYQREDLRRGLEAWGGAVGVLYVNMVQLYRATSALTEEASEHEFNYLQRKLEGMCYLHTVVCTNFIADVHTELCTALIAGVMTSVQTFVLPDGRCAYLAGPIAQTCTALKHLAVNTSNSICILPHRIASTTLTSLLLTGSYGFPHGQLPAHFFAQVTNLKKIEAVGLSSESVEALKTCVSLTHMRLEYDVEDDQDLNVDFSVLEHLKRLTHVEVKGTDGNGSVQVINMPHFPNLVKFKAKGIPVEPLNAVLECSQLTELTSSVPHGTVLPILPCVGLKKLFLRGRNGTIDFPNMEFLSRCTVLERVKFVHVRFMSAAADTQWSLPQSVRSFRLTSHNLLTIPPSIWSRNFDRVRLDCRVLTQICVKDTPLPRELELYMCSALKDITAISENQSIESVIINSCVSLSDLAPLTTCPNLVSLCISHMNTIRDLTPVAMCTSLTSLRLKACPNISDLSPLSALGNLVEIGVGGRAMQPDLDLRPLMMCPALKVVRLEQHSPSALVNAHKTLVKKMMEAREDKDGEEIAN